MMSCENASSVNSFITLAGKILWKRAWLKVQKNPIFLIIFKVLETQSFSELENLTMVALRTQLQLQNYTVSARSIFKMFYALVVAQKKMSAAQICFNIFNCIVLWSFYEKTSYLWNKFLIVGSDIECTILNKPDTTRAYERFADIL